MTTTKLSFKDWLVREAEQAEPSRARSVDEWKDATLGLQNQVIEWLADDDPVKLLKISTSSIQRHEEDLGRYNAPVLTVHLRDRAVDLVPISRKVVGPVSARGDAGIRAEGRVDLTNGSDRYMLYHSVFPDGKRWIIVDDENHEARELDRERFETALQDLLS